MRAHYFQHVPFEGLGAIESWLVDRGFEISRTAFFDGESPPLLGEVAFLVIMGGPMSVNDETGHPWLAEEKAFLRDYLATGRPVLGICLGAQLIASALGTSVYPNAEPEIGWFPLEGLPVSNGFGFPNHFEAFHWHGETFDLPPNAVHLARTSTCEHQAFRIGGRVVGLQFHLETTLETAAALIENCGDEIVTAPHVQSAAEMLARPADSLAEVHDVLHDLLESLVEP